MSHLGKGFFDKIPPSDNNYNYFECSAKEDLIIDLIPGENYLFESTIHLDFIKVNQITQNSNNNKTFLTFKFPDMKLREFRVYDINNIFLIKVNIAEIKSHGNYLIDPNTQEITLVLIEKNKEINIDIKFGKFYNGQGKLF